MPKPYENAELLKERLIGLGYSAKSFQLNDEPFTQFTSPQGHVWMINNDKIQYPFPSVGARLISKSKIWSNELVKQAGGNLPASYTVARGEVKPEDLRQILSDHSTLIVKPYDSTLSRGLTTDIDNVDSLLVAIDHALEFSDAVLVQEQVYGDDIRFIVINGKVKGVLLRQTPRVVGDGVSTLAKLIENENKERTNITLPFGQSYCQLTEEHISQDYLSSDKILEKGEVLELSREVLVRRGASALNITSLIHPSYIEEIERIANQLGRGYLAVDAFVKAYTEPNNGKNYWFLEFNSSPNLGLPYCVRDGNHYKVLDDLIPILDKAITNRLS